MPPRKKQVNAAAKKSLRQAGITRAYLAKTTGTTKNEVKKLFNTTARKMSTGGISPSDTKAIRKALAGGRTAGVKAQPKKATKMVRQARKNYRSK